MASIARYYRLKDDSIGVRCLGFVPSAGDAVSVTTKDGKQQSETVAEVLWSGTDEQAKQQAALCRIARGAAKRAASSAGALDQLSTEQRLSTERRIATAWLYGLLDGNRLRREAMALRTAAAPEDLPALREVLRALLDAMR